MNCLACGVVKDTTAKEVYQYPEDGIIDDEPIQPLFTVECHGSLLTSDERGGVRTFDWRIGIVCHDCLHRLDPDMWISDTCWASLNPVTPFHLLPHPINDESSPGARFEVEAYVQSLP